MAQPGRGAPIPGRGAPAPGRGGPTPAVKPVGPAPKPAPAAAAPIEQLTDKLAAASLNDEKKGPGGRRQRAPGEIDRRAENREDAKVQINFAAKKPPGTLGKQIPLLTNAFPCHLKPLVLARYVVEFTDPVIPQEENLERIRALGKFRRALQQTYGMFSFDGVSLCSVNEIKESKTFKLEGGDQKIQIVYGNSIDAKDVKLPEVQMVYNVMLKTVLRNRTLQLTQYNDKYYNANFPAVIKGLDQPLRMLQGFSLALNPMSCGETITMDLAHRVLHLHNMREKLNQLEEEFGQGAGANATSDEQFYEMLGTHANTELFPCNVITDYSKRIYRVDGFDFSIGIDDKFKLRDGSEISYRNYMIKQYESNQALVKKVRSMEHVPGLLVHTPKRGDKIFLIPELCFMTGVTEKMRSNGRVMKSLADFTRKNPTDRYNSTVQNITRVLADNEVKKQLNDFKLDMKAAPIEAKGRQLPKISVVFPPNTVYDTTQDRQLSFSKNVRDVGFFSNSKITNWALIYGSRDEKTVQPFVLNDFIRCSASQGTRLPNPKVYSVAGNTPKEWETKCIEVAKTKPEFVMCAIPRGDATIYTCVKYVFNSQAGIVSQCIDPSKLRDKNLPKAGNTYKQVMAKLGHFSWKLPIAACVKESKGVDFAKQPTMFIGMDVSHDKKVANAWGPRPAKPHSTVGMCITTDPGFSQYSTFVSYQQRNIDRVIAAEAMMTSAVNRFKEVNKVYPQNIVMYRDGVADSQIRTFVRREIDDFKKAFAKLGFNPKLTVVVVQKRVATRLFVPCQGPNCPYATGKEQCGQGVKHSPPPGTILDTAITSTTLTDFYLAPSIAPPGATARPTRFIVVLDDANLAMNDLQNVTMHLTMGYQNWPGPIRIPVMTMNANKAAYLYGKLVNGSPAAAMIPRLFML